MTDECDIAIVGAGAAGLAAGIFAAQAARNLRIVLLDSARSIGAKILVAGGGRCNVTHDRITPADYNGSPNIVRNVLAAFDQPAAVRWFESLGVLLKREETGKLFPATDSARTVLDALLNRCGQLNAHVRPQHRVEDICPLPQDKGFTIRHQRGQLLARRVVLATGGRSLPRTGSDGFGYELARRLGHSVTATYPALVPLVLDGAFFHRQLSGVSHPVELTTLGDGRPIDRRRGDLLWTHFGVSGPVVLDASRHWVLSRAHDRSTELRCSLLPGETFESLESALISSPDARSILRVLAQRLPERVARAILAYAQIEPSTTPAQLPRECRRKLVHRLIALTLPVVADRGWNHAEVTAGGVPLAEIDYRTMRSRRTPGLHLAGEILDCDGRIGGFNFQWAWATGYLAGRAAAST